MCQLTARAMVFLAGRLQAPGGWLRSAGVLAAVVVLVPYTIGSACVSIHQQRTGVWGSPYLGAAGPPGARVWCSWSW